jgi:low affinity Fe/Cu permease
VKAIKAGFGRFATWTAHYTGSAWAFLLASLVVVVWAVTGPAFKFSNAWQLVINTGTTIVTFLMIFLIQYTQNRDTRSIIVKLDELIRSTTKADNRMIDLEEMTDEELTELEENMRRLSRRRTA